MSCSMVEIGKWIADHAVWATNSLEVVGMAYLAISKTLLLVSKTSLNWYCITIFLISLLFLWVWIWECWNRAYCRFRNNLWWSGATGIKNVSVGLTFYSWERLWDFKPTYIPLHQWVYYNCPISWCIHVHIK